MSVPAWARSEGAGELGSAAFSAAVLASVAEAVVVVDAGGRVVFFNAAAQRLYRMAWSDVTGRRAAELLAHPEARRDGGGWTCRPASDRPLLTRHRRGDGTPFDAEVSFAPVRDDDGSVVGLAGVVRDVTDLVEAELELRERASRLERSNADLEQFAYAASHDLQEPLRSITMGAETVLEAARDRLDGDERALLGHVGAAATRMSAQVTALMALARVALGDARQAPVPVQLALDDAIDAMRAAIHEAGAVVDVCGPLPSAAMPRVELTLVLQNLLANAIRYRQPGRRPRVTLSGSVGDGYVELRVADNGIGLSEADRPRIFAIFGRADSGVPGTGIGLALCRRILERRSGSIAVASAGVGHGSEFTLRLPA